MSPKNQQIQLSQPMSPKNQQIQPSQPMSPKNQQPQLSQPMSPRSQSQSSLVQNLQLGRKLIIKSAYMYFDIAYSVI